MKIKAPAWSHRSLGIFNAITDIQETHIKTYPKLTELQEFYDSISNATYCTKEIAL